MNLNIEKTKTLLEIVQTEKNYWSSPDPAHEEYSDYLSEIESTLIRSIRGKQQYEDKNQV